VGLCSPHLAGEAELVAPASCRLSREPALSLSKGRLALGAAGEDALRTAAETAALRLSVVNLSYAAAQGGC